MAAPPHHERTRTTPKKVSRRANISSNRKAPNIVPDLEDLGKMLKSCGLDRGGKSDRSQSPNQKDRRTCDSKDAYETAVHALSQGTKQGILVSGEDAQYTKNQGVIESTKESEPKVPKVHKRVTKQDFKKASLDAALRSK